MHIYTFVNCIMILILFRAFMSFKLCRNCESCRQFCAIMWKYFFCMKNIQELLQLISFISTAFHLPLEQFKPFENRYFVDRLFHRKLLFKHNVQTCKAWTKMKLKWNVKFGFARRSSNKIWLKLFAKSFNFEWKFGPIYNKI